MGRAVIIENLEKGLYRIDLQYRTSRMKLRRDVLQAKVAELTEQESQITQEISDCGPIEKPVCNAEKINKLKLELERVKVLKMSAQKNLEGILSALAKLDTEILAWCLDFSDQIEPGTLVGTLETPGERREQKVNIQAGYFQNGEQGRALYSHKRDGQLTPKLETPAAQWFLNTVVLPGMQKWRPLSRYGTITSIDHENHLCRVDYDNAYSSAQQLPINRYSYQRDIPIKYPPCDSDVFDVGSKVVVIFEDHHWLKGYVRGFQKEPIACELLLNIFREFDSIELTGDEPRELDIKLWSINPVSQVLQLQNSEFEWDTDAEVWAVSKKPPIYPAKNNEFYIQFEAKESQQTNYSDEHETREKPARITNGTTIFFPEDRVKFTENRADCWVMALSYVDIKLTRGDGILVTPALNPQFQFHFSKTWEIVPESVEYMSETESWRIILPTDAGNSEQMREHGGYLRYTCDKSVTGGLGALTSDQKRYTQYPGKYRTFEKWSDSDKIILPVLEEILEDEIPYWDLEELDDVIGPVILEPEEGEKWYSYHVSYHFVVPGRVNPIYPIEVTDGYPSFAKYGVGGEVIWKMICKRSDGEIIKEDIGYGNASDSTTYTYYGPIVSNDSVKMKIHHTTYPIIPEITNIYVMKNTGASITEDNFKVFSSVKYKTEFKPTNSELGNGWPTYGSPDNSGDWFFSRGQTSFYQDWFPGTYETSISESIMSCIDKTYSFTYFFNEDFRNPEPSPPPTEPLGTVESQGKTVVLNGDLDGTWFVEPPGGTEIENDPVIAGKTHSVTYNINPDTGYVVAILREKIAKIQTPEWDYEPE